MCLLVLTIWGKIIGGRVSLRWTTSSNPGVLALCPSEALKLLMINALALSRIWYVASLIHMPSWVLRELSVLVFSFFWSGKHELVSRSVVIQPSLLGGFSVVDVKFNVWSLLGQWVKRFASSPSGWVSFMSFFVSSFFGLWFFMPSFCFFGVLYDHQVVLLVSAF